MAPALASHRSPGNQARGAAAYGVELRRLVESRLNLGGPGFDVLVDAVQAGIRQPTQHRQRSGVTGQAPEAFAAGHAPPECAADKRTQGAFANTNAGEASRYATADQQRPERLDLKLLRLETMRFLFEDAALI